ncbi:MAG TPA: peroxiredoxin-like family protein [Sphingobium sp.]|uniref:peroxiredoxin-like family protein n=1 Tax=Sphingobium sp. TaxID=1912891 RepID=UPI002ED0A034
MSKPSLSERFAALQAERERSWSTEQLTSNARQRADVVRRYDPAAHAQPGDAIVPFTLVDQDGRSLSSADILAGGPVVLIFYRFGGCPACNIALPYYNEALWPALEAAGIPLIAISPQVPVDRTPIETHGLRYTLASDPGYALERALGISFLPVEQPVVAPGQSWIGATLGTDSYELPQPSVVILNADHSLRFIAVSPDWLARPEAEEILGHLPEISRADAAE